MQLLCTGKTVMQVRYMRTTTTVRIKQQARRTVTVGAHCTSCITYISRNTANRATLHTLLFLIIVITTQYVLVLILILICICICNISLVVIDIGITHDLAIGRYCTYVIINNYYLLIHSTQVIKMYDYGEMINRLWVHLN